jgi:hypothetical protein
VCVCVCEQVSKWASIKIDVATQTATAVAWRGAHISLHAV